MASGVGTAKEREKKPAVGREPTLGCARDLDGGGPRESMEVTLAEYWGKLGQVGERLVAQAKAKRASTFQ